MSSPADGAVPLEGKLSDPTLLPRLFAWLGRGEWSGAVRVRSGDVERSVFFAEGRISTATSNDPQESLAACVLSSPELTPEALAKVRSVLSVEDGGGGAAGRQLVRMGLVSEKSLQSLDRRRAVAVAEAALALRTGSYTTESGTVVTEGLPQGLDVPRVVATAVLTSWEDSWGLDALGGADAILDIVPERLADFEATGAEEAYDLTFLRANGRRTVREILDLSPLPEGVALRFLAACRVLGCLDVVRRASAPQRGPDQPAATAATELPPAAAEPDGASGTSEESAAAFGPTAPPAPRAPAAAQPAEQGAVRAPRPTASGAGRDAPPARASVGTPLLIVAAIVVVAGLLYLAWRGWQEQLASGPRDEVGARP